MKIARNLMALLAVGWLAALFSPLAQAASVEELLAGVNKLPVKERQRRLEEGAKKEGNLVVYSNQGLDTIRAYADEFGKKYPFIKVDSSRLQGAKGLDRILLEHRVGKLPADVVGVDFDNIGELLKAGIHARYDSPEKKNFPSQFWDKNGRWYVAEYTLVVIAYNTNLVKPSEAPKDYADLLSPRFKGDISIDTEPEQAVFAWMLEWGEEKTAEYMKALYLDFILSEDGVAAMNKGGGTIPARKGAKAAFDEISNLEEKGIRMILIGHEKMGQLKEKGYKLMDDIIIRKQIR